MKKILNVGVWGLGRAGQTMHIKEMSAFPEELRVIAGCDIDPERRRLAAERTPELKIYDTPEAFLADPDLDLITIATRTPDHVDHAIQALETGRYVVCEKPVAKTVKEMMRLKAASDKHPGKLFIRHNRRFEKAFRHVLEIIATGKLGWIYEVKLRRHSFQWRTDWQTLSQCWGGQLLNWGPHLIDHALQFLDYDVESVWSDLKLVAAYGDAEDHFKLIVRGKSGRLVDVEVSGGVPLKENTYNIHGTRGTLIVSPDEKTIKMTYLKADAKVPQTVSSPDNPPLTGGFGVKAPKENWETEEFPVAPACGEDIGKYFHHVWETIVEGKPFPVTFEQALEVVRVTEIARQQSVCNVKNN